MKVKDAVTKLQALSETKKKIIAFGVIGVIGLIFAYFWIMSAKETVTKVLESGITTTITPATDIPIPSFSISETTSPSN